MCKKNAGKARIHMIEGRISHLFRQMGMQKTNYKLAAAFSAAQKTARLELERIERELSYYHHKIHDAELAPQLELAA